MKTKVSISFDGLPIPGGAATILEPTACGPDVASVRNAPVLGQIFVRIELDEGDERVAKVFALLQQHSVEFESFTFTEYSEDDRQHAPLVRIMIDAYESAWAGLRHGTKFDLTNACTNCHAGARQTSALYIDGDDLAKVRKHRAIGAVGAVGGEVLVDGGMAKKLKDAGVTGISFGDVRARLKKEKWTSVARDQILIEHVMPPMRSELTDEDKKYLCPVCRRGGRSIFPKKPYLAEDLVGTQDFNLTWEWFGEFWPENKERGFGAKWPSPYVLVTPKVMNIFREAGVKTFDWTPVGIEK